MSAPDSIGLVAEKAIVEIGNRANSIEKVAFRLATAADRDALIWITESMRDEEARLRKRVSNLAKEAS